jgi:glycosyltransferase involved in cell wall biosynthesis
VVVLACNAAATIGRCLEALRNQEVVGEFEVVVVWSGDPSTIATVNKTLPSAVVVGRSEPLPTGATRNLGIRHASGEVIAFLAADCQPDPHWLARRLAAHREGHRCVSGAVLCPPSTGPVGRAGHLLEYNAFPPGRPREVVTGSPLYNLSFRREVFERHGLYDEDLVCGEDTVFNRKLAHAGEAALFDPSVRLIHPEDDRLRPFIRHQVWHGAWFGRLSRLQGKTEFSGPGVRRLWRMLVIYPAGRLARLIWRTHRWAPERRRDLVLLAPVLLLGLAAATYGLLLGWHGRMPHR